MTGGGAQPHDDRDRDAGGRPRNARPRDVLGRPLPRAAAGLAPSEPPAPQPPAQALRLAQQLLDADRPFTAHEVLEAAWKAAPAPERELWRGLAQIAVGITHARRGNAVGAAALLRRGGERIAGYAGSAPHGVDAEALARQAAALADLIAGQGLDGLGAARLRVALLPAAGR